MAEEKTCELESSLAPSNIGSYNDAQQQNSETYATLV